MNASTNNTQYSNFDNAGFNRLIDDKSYVETDLTCQYFIELTLHLCELNYRNDNIIVNRLHLTERAGIWVFVRSVIGN